MIDVGTERGAPSTGLLRQCPASGGEFDIGAVEFTKAAAADLDVAPQSLAFGSVARGRTSASQFVTLSSAGNAPLTVTGLVFAGAGYARAGGFGLAQNCRRRPASHYSRGRRAGYVDLYPATLGAVAGSLTINSNDATVDAAADRVVTLSGTGTRLAWCTQLAGVPDAERRPERSADGDRDQRRTHRDDRADHSRGVRQHQWCGVHHQQQLSGRGRLAPNASCAVTVRFRSPNTFTMGTATLTVSDTEPRRVDKTVALVGFRLF